MTLPPSVPPTTEPSGPSLLRSAVWVAIGALIAAAIVCVIWVLVGPQNDIIGRAFLTILLLAAFAGAAIYDAHAAPRRPSWYVLASMVGWVVALLAGAFKIWLPNDYMWDFGFGRFAEFVAIVLVIRLALLHIVLFIKAHQRNVTPFTRIVTVVTVVLVIVLAVMLLIPLTFTRQFTYHELYWRFVVAITILAAVGTALVPLINALNSPRVAGPAHPAHLVPPAPAAQPAPQAVQQPWPTYVDGMTPLPYFPDGSPDWNAYYTGYPSPGAQAFTPAPHPAQQPYGQQPYGQQPSQGMPSAQAAHPAQPAQPVHPAPPAPPYGEYPPPPPLPHQPPQ